MDIDKAAEELRYRIKDCFLGALGHERCNSKVHIKDTLRACQDDIREKAYDCKPDYYPPDANVDAMGVQLDMRKRIMDAIGWPESRGLKSNPEGKS